MSQSLVKNYIHLITSTKHRQPFINGNIAEELYSYIGGICAGLECNPVRIGGYHNHIHALFLLNKKLTLIKAVEEIKSHSSGWIKLKGEEYDQFYWQSGYGAFSVNPSEVEKVIKYIDGQHEHHVRISFQDEYRAFLKKYKVEFDERFVWD